MVGSSFDGVSKAFGIGVVIGTVMLSNAVKNRLNEQEDAAARKERVLRTYRSIRRNYPRAIADQMLRDFASAGFNVELNDEVYVRAFQDRALYMFSDSHVSEVFADAALARRTKFQGLGLRVSDEELFQRTANQLKITDFDARDAAAEFLKFVRKAEGPPSEPKIYFGMDDEKAVAAVNDKVSAIYETAKVFIVNGGVVVMKPGELACVSIINGEPNLYSNDFELEEQTGIQLQAGRQHDDFYSRLAAVEPFIHDVSWMLYGPKPKDAEEKKKGWFG